MAAALRQETGENQDRKTPEHERHLTNHTRFAGGSLERFQGGALPTRLEGIRREPALHVAKDGGLLRLHGGKVDSRFIPAVTEAGPSDDPIEGQRFVELVEVKAHGHAAPARQRMMEHDPCPSQAEIQDGGRQIGAPMLEPGEETGPPEDDLAIVEVEPSADSLVHHNQNRTEGRNFFRPCFGGRAGG